MERITVICGHYGTGKTNFALHLAKAWARQGKQVHIVDLDIVNPYFCTNAYTRELESLGITVISGTMAGTTSDVPALNPAVTTLFDRKDGSAIIDAGGDDVGARALGRYAAKLQQNGYELLYVINAYRNLVAQPQEAAELLKEIEVAARLQATGLVNNSHLAAQTTAQTVLDSLAYAEEIARLTGLPLVCTTAPAAIAPQLEGKVPKLLPLELTVKLPWAVEN